jgi:hypothetical protein
LQTGERQLASLVRLLSAFVMPALALPAWWWLRNFSIYGFPDLFGLAAHDRVVVGQLRTSELIAQVGAGEYLHRAVETSFNSFFGQLGWMALPLPSWVYLGALAVLGLALFGWVARLMRRRMPLANSAGLWLGLAALLALAQYVYYNTEFVQFQGRYLFTALIPFALWAAGGLDGLHLLAPTDDSGGGYGQPVVLIPLLLLPLNVWLLWRIVPLLAPAA